MDQWPDIQPYIERYKEQQELLDSILYEMCERYPSHIHMSEIWAKVWLIDGAYSAGLKRNIGGAKNLEPVIELLASCNSWLDKEINSLLVQYPDAVPTRERIARVALLHGRLITAISKHTRKKGQNQLNGNSVRSFGSKYLHFHAPVVPIYDSLTSGLIGSKRWFPKRSLSSTFPSMPTGTDPGYWKHCVSVAHVVETWKWTDVPSTARNIDSYFLGMAVKQVKS